jgi:hypothetical protein
MPAHPSPLTQSNQPKPSTWQACGGSPAPLWNAAPERGAAGSGPGLSPWRAPPRRGRRSPTRGAHPPEQATLLQPAAQASHASPAAPALPAAAAFTALRPAVPMATGRRHLACRRYQRQHAAVPCAAAACCPLQHHTSPVMPKRQVNGAARPPWAPTCCYTRCTAPHTAPLGRRHLPLPMHGGGTACRPPRTAAP